MTSSYFRNADALLAIYDISDEDSFEGIAEYVNEVIRYTAKGLTILIGNKVDKEGDRKVSRAKGEEMAKRLNVSFFETSAKTGENIKELFQSLKTQLYQRHLTYAGNYNRILLTSIPLAEKLSGHKLALVLSESPEKRKERTNDIDLYQSSHIFTYPNLQGG
jgi:GTPase SAR1 family protein